MVKKIRKEHECIICHEKFRHRGKRLCCDTICYQRYRNSPEYAEKQRAKWLKEYYERKERSAVGKRMKQMVRHAKKHNKQRAGMIA